MTREEVGDVRREQARAHLDGRRHPDRPAEIGLRLEHRRLRLVERTERGASLLVEGGARLRERDPAARAVEQADAELRARRHAHRGSLENRARFAREVVRACRRKVPAGFIVGFRMSFESGGPETGLDLDENLRIMGWLAEDGVDYAHVSHLDLTAKSVKYPADVALTRTRAGLDPALPLVAAGGVRSRADADHALALGADVVAIGRAAIGNTGVPARLRAGESLARTPFDRERLRALGVSDDFLRYITTAGPLASLRIVA